MSERQQWAETGLGAVVLVVAAGFLVYALGHAGGVGMRGYSLAAHFGEAGSLAPGATVSVAGVKVGEVSSVKLDPKTFLADTTMVISSDVKLPVDSTVKITQDGLLGGQHLAREPGGALENMKPGAVFQNTQGAVDLFGLIGSFLRPQGKSSGAAGATGAAGGDASPASSSGG